MASAAALFRLVVELRGAPSRREVEDASGQLAAARRTCDASLAELVGGRAAAGADVLEVRAGPGEPLATMPTATVVHLARGVYARVPTREARIQLLDIAKRAATEAVVLHVAIENEGSYVGRIAVDAPRRLLRAFGARVPEPGDRFGPDRYGHCFFDEEALIEELTEAGLAIVNRRGFTFVLRAAQAREEPEDAAAFGAELLHVARMVRKVDAVRATLPPREALSAMRTRGRHAKARGPIGRARLRRAIGWIDAMLPGTASCYRRILLEVALDAGAARETVVFGLDVGSTGHVAFEHREERSFDVSFAIPAD